MVRQGERRLESLAGSKRDVREIGYMRNKPFKVSVDRMERYDIPRICRAQNTEIPLVKGKMHVIVAQQVEYSYFPTLNSRRTLRCRHRYQPRSERRSPWDGWTFLRVAIIAALSAVL